MILIINELSVSQLSELHLAGVTTEGFCLGTSDFGDPVWDLRLVDKQGREPHRASVTYPG